MKLAAVVTLPFLSVAGSDIFGFFILEIWTMELTEITNTCHFSDKCALTINVNIREMGNYGFLKIFT